MESLTGRKTGSVRSFVRIFVMVVVLLLASSITSGCKSGKKIVDATGAAGEWLTYDNGKCFLVSEDDIQERPCYKTGYLISFDEVERIITTCELKIDGLE